MAQTKIQTFIQKINGQPPREERPQDIETFWTQALPGRYVVEIKRMRTPKTYQQVKTVFGLMIESVIVQANDLGIDVSYFLKYLLSEYDPKGQGLTKDFLHELMYVICPTTDDEGRRVTLSKMSTVQAASLFERFRNIMAPLGINIPDPDPNWNKK